MFRSGSIRSLAIALFTFAIASNAGAANVQDINVGINYLPAISLPGAKVRTPGNIEYIALENTNLHTLDKVNADHAFKKLLDNEIDVWLGGLSPETELPANLIVKDLNWSASPVAIMRTDTDIKSWSDIKGRSVCISKDSRYIGELSHNFGAIEDIYPTVTDALLALRIGQCDATVQEQDFIAELLNYPEWQKFSAKLNPYKKVNLVELSLAENIKTNNGEQSNLLASTELHDLVKDQVRDIAFEVYLDQTVPDCH